MPVQAGISSEQPKLRVKNEMSNSTGRQNLSVSLRRGGNVDDDKVFQGLQKKQRCKLCEQEFFVDSLPGAISYNSVLKLRQKWGKEVHFPSPSLRYQKVKLCVFCSQFFDDAIEEKQPASNSKSPKNSPQS